MNIFRISETKIFIRGHDGGWALQPVDVDPASNLGMTIKSSQVETFSAHHQAVHFVPKGLSTVAVASVGIIEGLEDQTHPFCSGTVAPRSFCWNLLYSATIIR